MGESLGNTIGYPGSTGAKKEPNKEPEEDGWFVSTLKSAKKKLAETLAGNPVGAPGSSAKEPKAKPSSSLGQDIGYPGAN